MLVERKNCDVIQRYPVLGLMTHSSSDVLIYIETHIERSPPAMYEPLSEFNILCNNISKCWIIEMHASGNISFHPEIWINYKGKYSFWEDLVEDEYYEAVVAYSKARNEIFAEYGEYEPFIPRNDLPKFMKS